MNNIINKINLFIFQEKIVQIEKILVLLNGFYFL